MSPNGANQLLIIGIYAPVTTKQSSTFLQANAKNEEMFTDLLQYVRTLNQKQPILITGHFNQEPHHSYSLSELYTQYGFHDPENILHNIKAPTSRIARESATESARRIDYFLINQTDRNKVQQAETIDLALPTHLAVYVTINHTNDLYTKYTPPRKLDDVIQSTDTIPDIPENELTQIDHMIQTNNPKAWEMLMKIAEQDIWNRSNTKKGEKLPNTYIGRSLTFTNKIDQSEQKQHNTNKPKLHDKYIRTAQHIMTLLRSLPKQN